MAKTNREGLTWTEWARAAGVDPRRATSTSRSARKSWRAGVDPSEFRVGPVEGRVPIGPGRSGQRFEHEGVTVETTLHDFYPETKRGTRGLSGTPKEHSRDFLRYTKTAEESLPSAATPRVSSCGMAIRSHEFASKAVAEAVWMPPHKFTTLWRKRARALLDRTEREVRKHCSWRASDKTKRS